MNRKNYNKKVLVLDLDETLVTSCFDKVSERWNRLKPWDINPRTRSKIHYVSPDNNPYFWLERPHVHDFLRSAEKHFDHVVIYSAGTKEYVNEVVLSLFTGHRKPSLVLTNEDCINGSDGSYRKCLKKVIQLLKQSNFLSNDDDDNTEICLVDDREDNFHGDRSRGILIKSYDVSFKKKTITIDDDVLLGLKEHIDHYGGLSHLMGGSIGIN